MKYLKAKRKSVSLTQVQLAEILDISISHYTKIENGFSKPSYDLIKKLKGFYGNEFDINQLFK